MLQWRVMGQLKEENTNFPLPNTHSFGLLNDADLQSLPNLWMCFHPLSQIPEGGMVFFMEFSPPLEKLGKSSWLHRIDDECSWVAHKQEDLLLPKVLL